MRAAFLFSSSRWIVSFHLQIQMGPATQGQSSNGHPKTPKIHLGGRTEEKCFRRGGGEEEEEGWWEEKRTEELELGGGVRGREASRHSYHLRASPYYEVFVSGGASGDSRVG